MALRVLGAALLIASGTVLTLQVHVGGAGGSGRTCGSAFDVLADRAGWEEWYAADTIDAASSTTRLLRTLDCPAAVNHRSLAAGLLSIGGAVALGLTAFWRRPRATAPAREPAGRLRTLGRAVIVTGAALAAAGLATLGVLLANRDSTLFVYVKRPFVAVVGVVLLVPVLALIAGGRALMMIAESLDREDSHDETG